MRIAVNTRLLLKGKLEGIGWFAHELLSRIVRQHPEHQFIFFFDRPWDDSFIYGENVEPVIIAPQARHPFLYYIWTEYSIPKALKKYKADLYFSPDLLGCIHTKVPVIFTIHDLAFLHYPKYIGKFDLWHYKKYTPLFIKKAKRVIAVSEFTKQDITKAYGTPDNKIEVVYNGADRAYHPITPDEAETIKSEISDGEEYFLFVGALHPRKNVIHLLKAFVRFKRLQRTPMKLIIVGRMAWQSDEIQEAKERMPFKEEVKWLGYLDVEKLAKVTAAAYALVNPSWFEGFGIPVLEAMRCDVPVLVSDVSSLPEVAGNAGLLLNPASPEDIAAKMSMIYKDEDYRDDLIRNARIQCKKFDWDLSAEKLWKIFMEVVSEAIH